MIFYIRKSDRIKSGKNEEKIVFSDEGKYPVKHTGRDHSCNPRVTRCTFHDLVNIKERKRKIAPVTEKPCDACNKDCVGGIIYGNCQQFLLWRKEINQITVCVDALFKPRQKGHLPEC
jgi:hypothetical protein